MRGRILFLSMVLLTSFVVFLLFLFRFTYTVKVSNDRSTLASEQRIEFERLRLSSSQVIEGVLLAARNERILGLQTFLESRAQIQNLPLLKKSGFHFVFDEIFPKLNDFLLEAEDFFVNQKKFSPTESKIRINRILLLYQEINLQEDRIAEEVDTLNGLLKRAQVEHFISIVFITVVIIVFIALLLLVIFKQGSIEMLELYKKNDDFQARMYEMSRMADLGEIAANISHEIKNPLAVIGVCVEQLKSCLKSSPGPEVEKAKPHVLKIEAMFDRIVQTITAVQRAARQNSGELEIVDLSRVLSENVDLYKDRTRAAGIEIKLEGFDQSRYVLARSVELSQVFLNLINNSCDAIESLQKKWIQINILPGQNEFVLRFMDSGSGIPMEVQKHLFKDFYTTKPVGKGTGLGLAICRKIIKSYEGSLEIDNECANTCFVLKIPTPKRS